MPSKTTRSRKTTDQLVLPKLWPSDEIATDVATSRAAFIARREAEIASPLSPYAVEFGHAKRWAARLVVLLPRLISPPVKQSLLASIVSNPERFTALRYLAGPPVSEDDLVTLIGEPINGSAIRKNQALANAVGAFFLRALDKQRFPWVAQGRSPTPIEYEAAKISTAVAIACQRTQTGRRTEERAQLEGSIEAVLRGLGFKKVPQPKGKKIRTHGDLPNAGEYMVHCNIGKHNADYVIRLFDSRILAMECKASNTEINSRKRVAKETERDAGHWTEIFGEQVVTAAALRGVFSAEMIESSQHAGLFIFWEHRLGDLVTFINDAGASSAAP